MLQYKNGCFSNGNIAFSIPEGFFVDTVLDLEYVDGFLLCAPDQSYSIMIQIAEMEGTTETELQTMLDNCEFRVIQPMQPLRINELTGHCIIYQADNLNYYEARMAAAGTDGKQVILYIRTGKDIHEILCSKGAMSALHGIHLLE